MISFKKFIEINEGITVDGKLKFDYSSQEGISTKFGKGKKKTPFSTHSTQTDKVPVSSSYHVGHDIEQSGDIMKALKGKHPDITFEHEDREHFLSRTAQHLLATDLKGKKFDMIVTPKSSSDLVHRFAHHLMTRMPGVSYHPGSLDKAHIDNVTISPDLDNEKVHKNLTKTIDRLKKEGNQTLEMKRVLGNERRHLRGFLKADPEMTKKVQGKHVLILDDFLTSGSTIAEGSRILKQHGPASIHAATIFKVK